MSSDDCKTFLVQQSASKGWPTQAFEWKRLGKHKDTQGHWCRDFQHPQAGRATVIEDPAASPGFRVTWGSVPAAALMQGKFTPVEVAGALQLFQRLVAMTDDDPNDDVQDRIHALLEGAEYKRFGHALSAHVGFCFPQETYGNEGVDPTDVHRPVGNLNIVFEFRAASEPHGEPHWGLLEMIKPLLPSCLDFVDEMHAEAASDYTDSVLEFSRTMEDLGFQYTGRDVNGENEQDVFEGNLLAALRGTPGLVPTEAVARPSLGEMHEAIRSGDALGLKQILDAGGSADGKAPRGAYRSESRSSWLSLALEQNQPECFRVLLAGGADPSTDAKLASDAILGVLKTAGHAWEDFLGPLLSHPKISMNNPMYGAQLIRAVFQAPVLAKGPDVMKVLDRVQKAIEAKVGAQGLEGVWDHAMAGANARLMQVFVDRAAADPSSFVGRMIDEGEYRLAASIATEYRVQAGQVFCGAEKMSLETWFEQKAAEEAKERFHDQHNSCRVIVAPMSGGPGRPLPNRFLEEFDEIGVLRSALRRNAAMGPRPKP